MPRTGKVENLKPVQSEEEAREKGRKGGVKSGEVRRAKRTFREAAEIFLNMPANEQSTDALKKLKVETEDLTNVMAIVARLALKAQSGDIHASRLLMELGGELQRDKIESNVNFNVGNDDERVVFYIPDNGRD